MQVEDIFQEVSGRFQIAMGNSIFCDCQVGSFVSSAETEIGKDTSSDFHQGSCFHLAPCFCFTSFQDIATFIFTHKFYTNTSQLGLFYFQT